MKFDNYLNTLNLTKIENSSLTSSAIDNKI